MNSVKVTSDSEIYLLDDTLEEYVKATKWLNTCVNDLQNKTEPCGVGANHACVHAGSFYTNWIAIRCDGRRLYATSTASTSCSQCIVSYFDDHRAYHLRCLRPDDREAHCGVIYSQILNEYVDFSPSILTLLRSQYPHVARCAKLIAGQDIGPLIVQQFIALCLADATQEITKNTLDSMFLCLPQQPRYYST